MSDAAAEALADAPDAGAQALLPQGVLADAPTESLAAAGGGQQVQTVDALLFRDRMQFLEEAGGDVDALARRIAEAGLEGQRGFPGGPPGGFGPGGPGGLGPGGFGPGGGGFREGLPVRARR